MKIEDNMLFFKFILDDNDEILRIMGMIEEQIPDHDRATTDEKNIILIHNKHRRTINQIIAQNQKSQLSLF